MQLFFGLGFLGLIGGAFGTIFKNRAGLGVDADLIGLAVAGLDIEGIAQARAAFLLFQFLVGHGADNRIFLEPQTGPVRRLPLGERMAGRRKLRMDKMLRKADADIDKKRVAAAFFRRRGGNDGRVRAYRFELGKNRLLDAAHGEIAVMPVPQAAEGNDRARIENERHVPPGDRRRRDGRQARGRAAADLLHRKDVL